MSRRQLLALALVTVGCATGGTVALKHYRGAPASGTPASSVAALRAEAPVPRAYQKKVALLAESKREVPPGFGKARGWLNVTRAPTAADLGGRVVVLDFWTSCCINCLQTLPTLSALEKKHAKDPFLVVGVHTQKFDAEPEVERLRAAMIRYGITHPVAIDGDRGIWESWGVSAWPTVVVLDAKGRIVWVDTGEPDPDELEAVIESTLAEGSEQGILAKTAPTFLGREVDTSGPLAFPEKITRLPQGWAVADSGHDRIVLVDESGRVTDVIGDGVRGHKDGAFAGARFAHPQGLVALGDVLFVADTENHAVRALDRKSKTVTTVAGTGHIGHQRVSGEVDGKTFSLRSPWDLAVVKGTLYVALAGSHQVVTLDPATSKVTLFAGTGSENLADGPRLKAALAQPSGLATDGTDLFVLDSETSSIRKIELGSGEVSTLVGHALFVWGDKDGDAEKARLQHPIGLTYGAGALWVADTYNSKIKRVDPKTGETKTIAGGADHIRFFEPSGLAWGQKDTLLVADTNHGRIVKLSLDGTTSTLFPLLGLDQP